MTKKQKRMAAAVKYMQHYMNTYDKQFGYVNYTDTTYIEDILYGLGASLDEKKYGMAGGFTEFKKVLLAHLKDA